MDRPATTSPASARDIILEIVRNMREGLEPLHYSVLPPAIFHVYLHPDDMDRLRGILPRILEEARRALDAEIETLNHASLAERLKIARRTEPKISAPEGGWQISIFENTDDDVQPGDIVVSSELALPAKPEFGAGSMTKRISTRRMSGVETSAQRYEPAAMPAAAPGPASSGAAATDNSGAYAVIEYEDNGGRKAFPVMKDQIVIGRGGRDYWTDLKLDTLPDVSREHVRLRRDAASGKFFLKDLSRLGTTVNGEAVPSSVEFAEGERRDKNVEVELPAVARIGLAGVVFLEFRSTPNG
jgi:hypothetical protein